MPGSTADPRADDEAPDRFDPRPVPPRPFTPAPDRSSGSMDRNTSDPERREPGESSSHRPGILGSNRLRRGPGGPARRGGSWPAWLPWVVIVLVLGAALLPRAFGGSDELAVNHQQAVIVAS